MSVDIKDMPPGMTIETVAMTPDRNLVPVLFTAAGDAQPAGSLADVVGTHAAGEGTLRGHLRKRTSLVRAVPSGSLGVPTQTRETSVSRTAACQSPVARRRPARTCSQTSLPPP